MKKLLAIILAVILVMPTFAVWATDSVATAVTEEYGADYAVAEYNAKDTYEIGTAYTRKFENVTSYYVKNALTEEIGSSESGFSINNGNNVFAKIPLPVIPQNQSYENFYFNYTSAIGNYATEKLIKLPGDDWTFTETTTLNDEKISAALAEAAIANDSAVTVEPVNLSADTHYRVRADVTAYANECRYAGQDYMYIIIKNSSTKKIYGNVAHRTYPAEVMTIAFNTTDKFSEEYAKNYSASEFSFDDTYTVGKPYTRKFENITSYYINGLSTVNLTASEGGYSINNGNNVFAKIPLPAIPTNQNYEKFYFNYTTAQGYYSSEKLIKLPGDDWTFTETTTLNDEKISAALTEAAIANDSAVTVEPVNLGATSHYRVRADVTSYANECRYAGQDYMYIIIKNSSTKKIYSNVAHYKYPSEVMTIAFRTSDEFTEDYGATYTATEFSFDDTYTLGRPYTRKFATIPSYVVNNSTATEFGASEGGQSINKGIHIFAKVPLPKLPANQEYEKLYFNYTTAVTNYATESLLKLPGDDWVFTDTTTLTDETICADSGVSIASALAKAESAADSVVTVAPANRTIETHYRARADVTTYANECRRAGQDYMYIVIKNTSTKKVNSNVPHRTYPAEIMTIAFRSQSYSGLLNYKQSVEYEDIAFITTEVHKALDSSSNLHRDKGGYALFKLELPTLTANQSLADYKLNFCAHSNMLATDYNLTMFKVENGAEWMENDLVISDAQPLAGEEITDCAIYSVGKESGVYIPAKLTTYAKELIADGKTEMYVALKSTQANTFVMKSSGGAYKPYVEYTIYDSNGTTSGSTIDSFKIVEHAITGITSEGNEYTIVNNYRKKEATTALVAGKQYRGVFTATNYEDAYDMSIILASYIEENGVKKLDVVTVKNYSVNEVDNDVFVYTDGFVPSYDTTSVKAFLMSGNKVTPIADCIEATVENPVTEDTEVDSGADIEEAV